MAGAPMADTFFVPSHCDGSEILRGLAFNFRLRYSHSGWEFVDSCESIALTYGPLCRPGPLEETAIEWLFERGFAKQIECGNRVVITDAGRHFLSAVDETVTGVPVEDFDQVQFLHDAVGSTRAEFPDVDYFVLSQIVAQKMLYVVFGAEWVNMHIHSKDPPTNFFRNRSDGDADRTLGMLRVIHLAEMCFNLQSIAGIRNSLEHIRVGNIESGFSELEVGRLLYANKRDFRFVTPRGRKQDDYDLEIQFGSTLVAAETKCKIETSQVSESTLVSTLDRARSQLPEGRPGIIFVKLPPTWGGAISEDEFTRLLKAASDKFFRKGTKRVVSIKYHSSLILDVDGEWAPTTLLLEVDNPRHELHHSDWSVFSSMSRLPPHWLGILEHCSR